MRARAIGGFFASALPVGLRGLAVQSARELVYRKRHIQGVFKSRRYRGLRGLRLHLGCGHNLKSGWVNVDLNPAADLTLDVRERLPFDDESFSMIYSEHFYEHFAYPDAITHLLSECFRILEPGGIHLFAVPDGERVLRHYVTRAYDDHAEAQLRFNPAWCKTQMDHVNYCLRQNGEHQWYYDEETMRMLLESIGFVKIRRRDFDPALDQEYRRVGTMYIECSKAEPAVALTPER